MRDGDEDEDEDEKSDVINYEMLQARSLQLAAGQDDVVDLSRLVQIKGSKCRGYGSEILHLARRLAPSGKLNKKPDVTLQLHRKLQWREAEYNFDGSLRGAIQNNFRHCSGAGKVVGYFGWLPFSVEDSKCGDMRSALNSISVFCSYKEYSSFEAQPKHQFIACKIHYSIGRSGNANGFQFNILFLIRTSHVQWCYHGVIPAIERRRTQEHLCSNKIRVNSPSKLLTTPKSTPPPPTPTLPSKHSSPLAIILDPVELIFSTPPTSSHPFFDSLEDLPKRTTNRPLPRPSFESIECLANQPPPLPVMESPLPPLPPQLPPLGPNNPFPRLTHEMFCKHCQHTQVIVNDLREEMRFILNHILDRLNILAHNNNY
ncbi:hypothetical protein Tco_0116336 [Tanacetum coccineum]